MFDLLATLFSPSIFMPHGHCYFWMPELLWLQALSEIFTGLAYYFVGIAIVYFTHGRRDLPRKTVNLLVGTFLVFMVCGTTHLLGMITIWYPVYWLDGIINAMNAIISWYVFAFMLVPLIPIALEAPSPAQLEAANNALKQEIIERQRVEVQLRETLEEVAAMNQKLVASLQYAKVIQSSLLPNPTVVNSFLPKHFLLWMPRDIVGGDMVYINHINGGFCVAMMDCTGHGVPGALMTMIASTHLKRITQDEGCHDPANVLNRLNFLVKTSLQQDIDSTESDDGLDAAICFVKSQENKLLFAGARLPLIYVDNQEFKVIRGDKHSLGYKKSDVHFSFTTHTIELIENFTFYLATDGYSDELGGEKRLPFGNQRFRKLLLEHSYADLPTQKQQLAQAMQEYKGHHDRQDDITVLGFQVSL
jgi:serine phosphatase RsbU (regulator of sigma subunit)